MPKQNFNEKLIALLKTHPDLLTNQTNSYLLQSKTTHGNLTRISSGYSLPMPR
ncbi:MAG: hypothetical protein OXM61_07065 [Candidatus Poribacteria bacterium]|nr:hypothetical protein [Candidatus Poribacteria bacterium]